MFYLGSPRYSFIFQSRRSKQLKLGRLLPISCFVFTFFVFLFIFLFCFLFKVTFYPFVQSNFFSCSQFDSEFQLSFVRLCSSKMIFRSHTALATLMIIFKSMQQSLPSCSRDDFNFVTTQKRSIFRNCTTFTNTVGLNVVHTKTRLITLLHSLS